jgi:hypothetical protein
MEVWQQFLSLVQLIGILFSERILATALASPPTMALKIGAILATCKSKAVLLMPLKSSSSSCYISCCTFDKWASMSL